MASRSISVFAYTIYSYISGALLPIIMRYGKPKFGRMPVHLNCDGVRLELLHPLHPENDINTASNARKENKKNEANKKKQSLVDHYT